MTTKVSKVQVVAGVLAVASAIACLTMTIDARINAVQKYSSGVALGLGRLTKRVDAMETRYELR